MPTKASKFCSKCKDIAFKDGLCVAHFKERSRDKERVRTNTHLHMYHDSRWDGKNGLRLQQLRKEPLCCECLADGILTPATVADHITPHKGDPVLFFDPDNLQSMCKLHHGIKTVAEDGGLGRGGSLYYPYGIPRPETPLIVVSGPPCSGKTSYVERHKQQGDAVIDVDVIAHELSGYPIHDARNQEYMESAIAERNMRLAQLAVDTQHKTAWLISTSARRWQRDYWRDRFGAKVYVLLTPEAECVRRGDNDTRRLQTDIEQARRTASIKAWWKHYEPADGDIAVY